MYVCGWCVVGAIEFVAIFLYIYKFYDGFQGSTTPVGTESHTPRLGMRML